MHLRFITCSLFILLQFSLFTAAVAQNDTKAEYQANFALSCVKVNEPIKIDGLLTDAIWQSAPKANQFYTKWPKAGEPALVKSEVQIAYDNRFLYVAATCHGNGAYIIRSLKRDVEYWGSDGFAVVLDPTNQSQKGYFFGVNQMGVQTEGILTGDDGDDIFTWDNRWYSEATTTDTTFYIEMAIPFSILRFNASSTIWGLNFIRNDPSNGYWHTWTSIPLNFDGIDLGYTGQLKFAEGAPSKTSRNINVSPYLSTAISKDYTTDQPIAQDLAFGVDAKVGLGSGLNLDLTFRPDFSQVEVDEQVVNLTRFDVRLPEKRTFFLENADIFGKFGIPPIRPFFSRRIGLDSNGQPQSILFGARLTGSIGDKTQIGLMNMQTESTDNYTAQNFTAVSTRRVLFGRTTLGGYFHNRQNVKIGDDFKRNAGAEFLYSRPDGKWSGWAAHHQTIEPKQRDKSSWQNAGFGYFGARFESFIDFVNMGENYSTDLGFEGRIENYDAALDTTLRIGYTFFFSETNARFPSKNEKSKLNIVNIGFKNFTVFNPDQTLNEQGNTLSLSLDFKNTMNVEGFIERQSAWVPVSFRFDNRDNNECPPLPAGQYIFNKAGLSWSSDNRKKWAVTVGTEAGGFYNGTIANAQVTFEYRLQPFGRVALAAQYNAIDFPEPYCDVRFLNVTPRVEVFFNRKINWTVFAQYNDQADAFNLNSRIQWRFRPMSDLFLVYSSNALASKREPLGRAVVAKFNYWF
jgi:hypothetical protein